MSDDLDARLSALLAPPSAPPDEYFAGRVQRAVLAEEKMAAARARAWKSFAAEWAATGAVILAFILLGRAAPAADGNAGLPLMNPAVAGVLLLALWVGVALRPGSAHVTAR